MVVGWIEGESKLTASVQVVATLSRNDKRNYESVTLMGILFRSSKIPHSCDPASLVRKLTSLRLSIPHVSCISMLLKVHVQKSASY